MGDVVEHEPRKSEHLHILPRADAPQFALRAEGGVLRVKGKEHERLKAARLVLQVAQGDEMIDALLDGLDVSVHHGCIRPYAQRMGDTHTVDPLRTRRLVRADDLTHAVGEDLRPAAREGRQPRRLQCGQYLAHTPPRILCKVHDLDGRERLDVRVRERRTHLPHDVLVVGKRAVGVQCAHDVNLGETRRFPRRL